MPRPLRVWSCLHWREDSVCFVLGQNESDWVKKLFFVLLIILIVGPVVLAVMAVQDDALVSGSRGYSAVEIDQAKALIKRNDPRWLDPGEVVSQWVDENELALLAGYALAQLEGGNAAVELHPGRAYVNLTAALPENPLGRYLNLHLALSQVSASCAIDNLRIGDVTIPGALADPALHFVSGQLERVPEYRAALEAVNGFRILEDRMVLVYQWCPELLDRLKAEGRDLLVDEDERQRLVLYGRQIANVAASPDMGNSVSLARFMSPLFRFAQIREGDPVAENKAALLALSMYVGGVDTGRLLGLDRLDMGPRRKLTLSGRHDFAQHFLMSAALEVTGGPSIADAVGLLKELDDAGGGSGFSFTDLGADRAGVRMAEAATRNASNARAIQAALAGSADEDQFMPDFLDLPELLPNAEFKARYGEVGSARYQAVADDIERRLDQIALYR